MKNPRKLHLGCGTDIKKGYLNLDKAKIKGADVVHDLDKYPWPFKDNYFDEVYGQDVIEHVKDLFKSMQEIHRICSNGATVRLVVPYWHSSAAFYPNHHYFFNVDSMKFFTEPNRTYDSYPGFKMEKIRLIPSRIGWIIPPIPMPKSLFPNVIDLRHLASYLLGEIILKIDFTMKVVKNKKNEKKLRFNYNC
ncbi:methyltransferase domain-containing protein [Candidatus Woesearchaeota archaeon]|nr:methyltransferase domain-containing protein [Candidatus Woesearchaeota archaeon]